MSAFNQTKIQQSIQENVLSGMKMMQKRLTAIWKSSIIILIMKKSGCISNKRRIATMKKLRCLFTTILCLLLIFMLPAAAFAEEQKCGDALTWTLDDNGLLTISGSGPMYNYSVTSTDAWLSSKNAVKNVKIDGAATIGKYAFYGCGNLEGIDWGSNVTSIGDNAFSNCASLATLDLPDSLTSLGAYAFNNCDSLTGLELPANLTTLGNRAFYDCDGLTDVKLGNGTTTIGSYAFGSCDNLSTFTMNEGLKAIGELVFSHSPVEELAFPDTVTSLAVSAITGDTTNGDSNTELRASLEKVHWPAGVTAIPDYQFSDFSALKTIEIPENVTEIGKYAFSNCTALENPTFPESLQKIDYAAFSNCDGLTELSLSYITELGARAFYNCDGLVSVALGNVTTTIGDYVFANCDKLATLTLGDSLETIGEYAFYYTPLTELNIPDTVTTMPGNAIQTSSSTNAVLRASLEKLHWPEGVKTVPAYVFYGFSALKEVVLPDGVETIKEYAFYNCPLLEDLTLSETLAVIERNAFENCDSLTELSLPNSVTTLGKRAFYDCDGLTEVKLGSNMRTIEDDAFNGCDKLKSFTMNSGLRTIGNNVFFACPIEELVFPDSMTALPGGAIQTQARANSVLRDSLKKIHWPAGVTAVPAYAFDGFTNLEQVDLPNGVTEIKNNAFRGCTALNDLTLPNTLTAIGDYAFYNCDALTAIELPDSVETVGKYTFSGCDMLTDMTLGASTLSLGDYAFFDCRSLKTFEMNDGLKTIGSGMFVNSPISELYFPESVVSIAANALQDYTEAHSPLEESLKTVIWPKGVTVIPGSVFAGFPYLENVMLPDEAESIAQYAFKECAALKSMKMPASLKEIGAGAFENCAVTSVNFTGDMPIINQTAFTGVTAVAGYPEENNTYTVSNMLDYGGDLTWAPGVFIVSFVLSGGSPVEDQVVVRGEKAEKPLDPKKDGCFFVDWYTDETFTSLFDFDTSIDEDTAIYAKWATIDLVTPLALTTIEEEAFCESNFVCAKLSEKVEKIGKRAFADCPNFRYIFIPVATTEIADDAFENIKDQLRIYCTSESYAKTFAENNGIPYRLVDDNE